MLRVVSGIDPNMGGPTTSSINSAIAADRAGAETTVVFAIDETFRAWAEAIAARLTRDGLPVASFPLWRLFPTRARRWAISFPLARHVLRSAAKFDVVHAHGAWTFSTAVALCAARVARRPSVLSPHESLTTFDVGKSGAVARLVKRLIRRVYLRTFDLIVVASELEARDSFRERPPRRAAVIYHPVTDEREKPEQHARWESREDSALRLGYLGRLDPKKNVNAILEVLPRLPEEITLLVGGSGAAAIERNLKALARELGVDRRVTWLGFIPADAKASFFARIDLLVVPSEYESFGVVAAEAMLHGVPVLVSATTGIAEVVRRHDCGFVVLPERDAIRAALHSISEAPRDRLTDLGRRAAETAASEFSFRAHGLRLHSEYAKLLKGGPAPTAAARLEPDAR